MLLLSGMLLVVGFVSLSIVFTEVDRLQERSGGVARTALLDPLAQWLDRLNMTLGELAPVGSTNLTWFGDQVATLIGRMEADAGRQGVYLEAALQTTPSLGLYWRESRCVAFSADTAGGVVVGFEDPSRIETITGAVLHLKATDGRETIESDVYVKMHDCLPGTVTTWFAEIEDHEGEMTGEENARSIDDGNAAMELEEEYTATPPEMGEPSIINIETLNWQHQDNIHIDDGVAAERPGTATDDYLSFDWDLTGYSQGTFASGLSVRLDVWNNGLVVDDKLMLVAIHASGTLGPWEIPVPALVESTYYLTPPTSPSGDALWDLDELAATEWRLYTEEGDRFDPGSKTYVDLVDLVFTHYTAYHTLDVTFDFPKVPTVFTEHTLWIRYQITGGNDAGTETFDLQVWDGAAWNTRLRLSRVDDTWQTVSYALLPAETQSGVISLRLVDSGSGDGSPLQQDTVQVDGLWLVSGIPGAP